MAKVSYAEALGQRESILLSEIEGQRITIVQIEFETMTLQDGTAQERAFITDGEGKLYRTSNKAILGKLHKFKDNVMTGSTVEVGITWTRAKKGGQKYLDLTA